MHRPGVYSPDETAFAPLLFPERRGRCKDSIVLSGLARNRSFGRTKPGADSGLLCMPGVCGKPIRQGLCHRQMEHNPFIRQKALERYGATGKAKKYYEDKWLRECDLSRSMLLSLIENRKKHPLFKFLHPNYEDVTKMRMLSSEVGYYICAVSTLLWTPFSPACRDCLKSDLCKERTRSRYPELYRIRLEEFSKEE